MARFERYIGIDYSGAQTPKSSLKGLRIYSADQKSAPKEVLPPPGPRKYWTRRGIAEWLARELQHNGATIVGIDHAFSFPLSYFETYGLPHEWTAFLDDFHAHWPTDDDHMYVDFIRDGLRGNGAARAGNPRWRRITEIRARAKSAFHFDVQGTVAKSTHAGLPWLRYLKRDSSNSLHFWPFDGWDPPAGRSVIVEVYPALWNKQFSRGDHDQHQHDAYSVVAWLRRADLDGSLEMSFRPTLTPGERKSAQIEGWIFGVA